MTLAQASAVTGVHQRLPSHATRWTIPAPTPPDASVTTATLPPRFRSSATGGAASVTAGAGSGRGGDQPLRHPAVHVAEAVEAHSPEDAAVVQRAAVELHVGEVLEQD